MTGTVVTPPGPFARAVSAWKSGGVPPETYLFGAVSLIAVFAYRLVSPGIPVAVQVSVIAVLVALLGLPHGALDPIIAHRVGLWHGPKSLLTFLLGYAAISALVLAIWWLAPVLSLIAFLAISAAHFGGDWAVGRFVALRLLAGAALLSLPSLRNANEVAELYVMLSGPAAAEIAVTQAALGPALLAGLVVTAVIAAQRRFHEGLELLLVAAIALTTPPLVFFIIYFCLLHSVRHLREGLSEQRDAFSRPRTLVIVATATVVPILIAVAFMTLGAPAQNNEQLMQIVFVGLAALTVPHMMLVMLDERASRSAGALA